MKEESVFAKRAFHEDYSPVVLGHIKIALNHGYILANKCMDDNDFLKAHVGKRNRSQLQNSAIEHTIKNRAERFGLNIRVEEANNSKGTFLHYRFYVGKSIFTVSRTTTFDSFPREAIFRSINSSLNSQMEMVQIGDTLKISSNLYEDVNQYYSILTYGGKMEANFMSLGVPNSDIDEWLYQYNLANALTQIEQTLPEREEIAKTNVAAVKDEFIKRHKDVAEGE